MNGGIAPIISSHSPRYHLKMHILQASVLIDPISLNKTIGSKMISMIQLSCNSQSVRNVASFHTTFENKIDEQSHWQRYVDP
jgi:hypothetical protein